MIYTVKPQTPIINWGNPLTNSLIDAYPFFDAAGTTVRNLAQPLNGTWNGTFGSQWKNSTIGVVGNFNGTNNYVLCKSGFILAGKTNFSISLWMKSSTTPPTNGASMYVERAASGNDILKMEVRGDTPIGALRFTYRDDAGTLNRVDTGASFLINDGKWHHCVATKAGTSVIVYLDGINRAPLTLTATDTFTNASPESRLGGDIADAAGWYTGNINEVKLWSRTLTAQEVMQLYVNPWQIYSKPSMYQYFISSAAPDGFAGWAAQTISQPLSFDSAISV